jgi:hypothetical protein
VTLNRLVVLGDGGVEVARAVVREAGRRERHRLFLLALLAPGEQDGNDHASDDEPEQVADQVVERRQAIGRQRARQKLLRLEPLDQGRVERVVALLSDHAEDVAVVGRVVRRDERMVRVLVAEIERLPVGALDVDILEFL